MKFCTFSDFAWVHHIWRIGHISKNRLTLSALALKAHMSWQNGDACVGMSKNRPGSRKELICWGSSAAPGMECMGASFSKRPSLLCCAFLNCCHLLHLDSSKSLRFRSCLYLPSHHERRGAFSFQGTNLCIPSVCIPAPMTESRPETSLREQSPTALHFVSHCHTETWHCHITAMKMS